MKKEIKSGEFPDNIKNVNDLEFVIFCIENTAIRLGKDGNEIYRIFSECGLLDDYIIPNIDVLHTQDKDYIIDELLSALSKRGIEL